MINLDGTPNKARLGARHSRRLARGRQGGGREATALPLYRYVGGVQARVLPTPMMNIVNGGVHADNPIDFQEFMIMPTGAPNVRDAIRWGAEIFHTLKAALKKAGLSTSVGDEGGFAPNLPSAEAALDFIMKAIETAGFKPGVDVHLCSDCAATEFFKDGKYVYEGEGVTRSIDEQVAYLAKLASAYPIVSIEDGIAEDDWEGWKKLADVLGKKVQLVGDDLFVTNVTRLTRGIEGGIANSLLVKVNQIGTLTETLASVETAHRAAYTTVFSHRSGETEETEPSPISSSRRTAARSRPARSPVPTAPPNTTSSSASRKSLATRRSTPAKARSRRWRNPLPCPPPLRGRGSRIRAFTDVRRNADR